MSKRKFSRILRWVTLILLMMLNTYGCGPVNHTEANKVVKTQRLIVGGSGTNLPITRTLANAFMEKNPDIKIIIPESLGSAGGIKSVSSGIINLGLVSRELTPAEQKSGLTYLPYCTDLVVFATNVDLSITNLTYQQINNIYNGKINNWKELGGPNQKIILLTREYNDSSKIVWDQYIPGFKAVKIAPEAILLRTDQAMDEAITSIDYSIGWTDLGSITLNKHSVTTIKLNGVPPTYEMNAKGKYPFSKTLAFVFKGKPTPVAQRFIDFVNGVEGSKILLSNGYLP